MTADSGYVAALESEIRQKYEAARPWRRRAIVRNWVNKLGDLQGQDMSYATKIFLLDVLTRGWWSSPGDTEARDRIYSWTHVEPGFEQRHDKLIADLAQQMQADPRVANAISNWTGLERLQKLEVLQTIAESHAGLIGLPAPSVNFYDGGSEWPGARCIARGRTGQAPEIKLNMAVDRNGRSISLEEALNEVLLDGYKRLQDRLVREQNAGQIEADNPDATQAQLFAIAERRNGGAHDERPAASLPTRRYQRRFVKACLDAILPPPAPEAAPSAKPNTPKR